MIEALNVSEELARYVRSARLETAAADAAKLAVQAYFSERSNAHTELDPHGMDQHQPGAKLDAAKPLPWLCISGFATALSAVAEVTTRGARKYTPNGWMHVEDGERRYMEAFARHMLALAAGEHVDLDTGCLHKAQMIWNLLASLELELRKSEPLQEGLR